MPGGSAFFETLVPWSTLAAVGRAALGKKDMSQVRTSDKLYNVKVKRAGSARQKRGCGWLQLAWVVQLLSGTDPGRQP